MDITSLIHTIFFHVAKSAHDVFINGVLPFAYFVETTGTLCSGNE